MTRHPKEALIASNTLLLSDLKNKNITTNQLDPMSKPQIILDSNIGGIHNSDLKAATDRLTKEKTYQDLSTICIIPTRGLVHATVLQTWLNMMVPMNQKFMRMFIIGMEVGAAYNSAIEMILGNDELSRWKYVLTLEEDNTVPPDGLLRLYDHMDKFDGLGGLYWTKGEAGQPMCYGNPAVMPKNFIPQIPLPDTVTQCNGLGMGFTLLSMKIFKDKKFPKPWFETVQRYTPGQGVEAYTQDLKFFEKAGVLGYKFACDSRVKVGHFDVNTGMIW